MSNFIQDSGPAPEEDWGQNSFVGRPNDQGRNAVAPSEVVGCQKFADMLKRDSPTLSWKVAFKTVRKTRIGGDERLPAGFPGLHTFFFDSKSLRVFKWAWNKYRELYPYDPDAHDADPYRNWVSSVTCFEEWHPQKLRAAILTKLRAEACMKDALSQKKLLFLVNEGFFDEMAGHLGQLPATIRAKINWNRVRWVIPVRRYALAWLENHAQITESKRIAKSKRHEFDEPECMLLDQGGRISPSLMKRPRVA